MRLPCRLNNANVAIVGLGLMGGSIALGLLDKCKAVYGVDHEEQVVSQAKALGVFSQVSTSLSDILPMSDVVILAIPVKAIITIIKQLPQYHPGHAIVLDLGSTKFNVVKEMDCLPERFDPIGGHPMCGKEKSSLFYADPNIYQGAPFSLTPLSRTTHRAHNIAIEIINCLGAYPVWLDPLTHDRWTAMTSHLPYLLANALANATSDDVQPLIGSGFRSTTRIAVSDIKMMVDILKTNRENVLNAMDRFEEIFLDLKMKLQRDEFEELAKILQKGIVKIERLEKNNQIGDEKCS